MKRFACALLCATGLLLLGCGTPSQSLHMGLSEADALQMRGWMPEALRGQMAVGEVGGGSVTSRWWGSRVSSLALAHALEDSLRSVGLFAQPAQGARYLLRAQLLAIDQPLLAADTTVTVMVDYRLVDTRSDAIVYQRVVRTAQTADFGAAMLSQPERMRLANEGAIRQTVNVMLRDLANLRL